MLEPARWTVALAALLGCTPPTHPPAPDPPALTVELAGCRSVRKGPVCTLDASRTLRLWVATDANANVKVAVDGIESPSRPAPVAEGQAYRLDVPANAQSLRVTAERSGVQTTRAIEISADRRPAAVHKANELRAQGKLDEAQAILQPLMEASDPAARMQANRVLARIERVRGNTKRAIELLRETILQERRAGNISDEMEDRFALAFTLLYTTRAFSDVREVLEVPGSFESEYPEGKVTASYYRGLLAYETGDLRAALRMFRESSEGARRLDLVDHRRDVLQLLADLLSTLGRYEEAEERMREAQALLGADSPPCRRAGLLNNLAWIEMRAPRSRRTDANRQRIEDQLKQALTLLEGDCATPSEKANVLTNLAIIAWEQGDLDDAQQHIRRARQCAADPDPRLAVWWATMEGHLARARNQPRAALQHFGTLERVGAASSMPEASLEGTLGRARTLADLGKIHEARAAYAQADDMLDRWSLEAPSAKAARPSSNGTNALRSLASRFSSRPPARKRATLIVRSCWPKPRTPPAGAEPERCACCRSPTASTPCPRNNDAPGNHRSPIIASDVRPWRATRRTTGAAPRTSSIASSPTDNARSRS